MGTRGPHSHEGVPNLPVEWGPGVPNIPVDWGPGVPITGGPQNTVTPASISLAQVRLLFESGVYSRAASIRSYTQYVYAAFGSVTSVLVILVAKPRSHWWHESLEHSQQCTNAARVLCSCFNSKTRSCANIYTQTNVVDVNIKGGNCRTALDQLSERCKQLS